MNSLSNADFSSDDNVKDPNFQPNNHIISSDSEDDVQPVVNAAQFNISSQPRPSCVESQSYNTLSHPSSINSQPSSIDSQPYVEAHPLSRKRKAYPESWKRNRTKALRNCGKAYTTMSKSKKVIPAKEMGPVCSDSCKLKCSDKFSFEERLTVFNNYWQSGDLNLQRQFIYNNMIKIEPKYRYIRVESTRQNFNHAYNLPQNNKRIRVCKVFFMNTLAISDKTIRTVVKRNSGPTGIQMQDNRGKHGKQLRLDAALKAGAKMHINSVARIESHYCRARSKREYIEGNLSIAALHRDYVDKCKAEGQNYLSYKLYYNIFVNDFNISFWHPKKDQCEDCTAFANAEDKTLFQEKYDLHQKEKSLVRAEKENDKKNISDNFLVCVYDLQSVMPCPRGEVSSFFYISKLNVLNFTITELGTNNTKCFVWHEGAGARGVNEIGSCVLMYLKNLNEKASCDFDIVFYSDNCCGQQKNKFMLAMYQYAINELPKLRSITHKFLIKGHTQNEGDAAHSLIQRNISSALKSSPIYVPDQYITLIKTAKKKGTPFVVHELTHDSFFDLKSLADGNYTTTEDGQKLKWADIKVIKVHRDYKKKFFFKTSYDTEEFTAVATLSKKKTNTILVPKKLYKHKLNVSETKKQGILKLIEKNIIPKYYQSFYENL
ncbi:unnamed protein product [Euphydryas editha]|uniref:DUF7869 domain-containing protein n=1 Tax=Euphydryas editha TaxID=104508 RepID=A0AAU9TMY8_EUPED|nr:unnamed protein product [Euphydryas editha]